MAGKQALMLEAPPDLFLYPFCQALVQFMEFLFSLFPFAHVMDGAATAEEGTLPIVNGGRIYQRRYDGSILADHFKLQVT